MLRKLFPLFLLFLAGYSRPASASVSTSNKFVSAVVDDTAGWIWFLAGSSPTVPPSVQLSARYRSFLSVQAAGKVYSNNYPTPPRPDTDGRPDVYLLNGLTTKLADTVITLWHEKGFDIEQSVYPVAFVKSGQIVLRIRVINHTGFQLTAQAEYVLDASVAGNDSVQTLTAGGSDNGTRSARYSGDWQYFLRSDNDIPLLYASFQHSLASGNLGLDGTGYLSDAQAPTTLGLITPETFIVGDMHQLHPGSLGPPPYAALPPFSLRYFSWGYFPGQVGPCSDYAYLLQWALTNAKASGPDTITELGRTSYGTGEFDICSGGLIALTYYPHRLKYDVGKNFYIQNPFFVETLVFNPSATMTIPLFTMSQFVKGPIQIVAPQPISPDGLGQVQTVASIPPLGVAEVQWMDSALHSSATTTDSVASIKLHASISGGFNPECQFLPLIEGSRHDPITPIVTTLSSTGSFDGSLCNTRCVNELARDTGSVVSGIAAIRLNNALSTNMSLSVSPFAEGSDSVLFSVCVEDSLKNGDAAVAVIDRATNVDSLHYHYCTIADTLAPYITWTPAGDDLQVHVNDNRPWDRGIASIDIPDSENIVISGGTLIGGTPTFSFTVKHRNPDLPFHFSITAKDESSNASGIYYYSAPRSGVAAGASHPSLAIAVFPNPTRGIATIQLIGADKAEAEVTDAAGRTIESFSISASHSWDMSKLASGTYTLRVMSNGAVVTGRIIKE